MYTAACLCGGVRLKIKTEIAKIYICHCKQCQKAQGTAFAAIAPLSLQDVEMISGEELLTEYFATENKRRVFCKQCGSPIYSARLDLPDTIRLRVGIINEPLNAEINSHAFTQNKADWYEIHDHAPQYKEKLL